MAAPKTPPSVQVGRSFKSEPPQEPSSTSSGVGKRESDSTGPRIVAVTPCPNSTPNTPPAELIVTFNEPVRESTINTGTIRVTRSGGDGTFNDGNEVEIVPAAVELIDPTTARVDLAGAALPDDRYRVLVLGGNTTGLASSSSNSSSSNSGGSSSTASTSNSTTTASSGVSSTTASSTATTTSTNTSSNSNSATSNSTTNNTTASTSGASSTGGVSSSSGGTSSGDGTYE
ncbi:MAG: Ig-like domain-containing protein [Planctomycetes bacterium]|nr:Ig-like domain-containing protein [Planctomycetota bacterium]